TLQFGSPMVPLMSAPFAAFGSAPVVPVMGLQAVLQVVCGLAVAGTTIHLAGRRTAAVAGVVAILLAGSIGSARSFNFALAAAAFLASACWAIAASDEGRRRWPMIAAGACLGAML